MDKIISIAKEYRANSNYEAFALLCKEHSVPEETQDQFWNGMRDDLGLATVGAATEKIDKELKEFKGGQKGKAVSYHVAKTLKSFCNNPLFAAAVAASKKTLSDCCEEIMKGVGNSVSDIEVYRRAAKFYFPGASVKFNMLIEVNGDTTAAGEPTPEPKPTTSRKKRTSEKDKTDVIQVSLFDL